MVTIPSRNQTFCILWIDLQLSSYLLYPIKFEYFNFGTWPTSFSSNIHLIYLCYLHSISKCVSSNILKTADSIRQKETVIDFFRGNSPHSVHVAINVHFSCVWKTVEYFHFPRQRLNSYLSLKCKCTSQNMLILLLSLLSSSDAKEL